MTCREFSDVAGSLTLTEISQAADEQFLLHSRECQACSSWLQEQRTLAGALQGLSARTTGREASASVEQALLLAFRERTFESVAPPRMVLKPRALRLSRWFEVGAFAAVAAACLIAIFLGYRVWRNPAAMPILVQSAPTVTLPSQTASTRRQTAVDVRAASTRPQTRGEGRTGGTASRRTPATSTTALADEALVRAEYTDLMFCDPLSCSSDAQVVRMELPAPGSSDAQNGQTVMADVVVGDDGLVRAVRIIN